MKIDFIVTWVDSNDPEWIKLYNHYRPEKPITDSSRFRNWDIFKYWFRAVEKYAPWVNKVFLVTNGKYPDWINTECKKLVLVKHSDYIPEKYLPTFNSNTIELNFGRIKELSEHFVLFNDDVFINAPVEPNYYFREGLPCDCNYESPYSNRLYTKDNSFGIGITRYCNVAVLNGHFNRKEVVHQAWKKWYGKHMWGKPMLLSLLMLGREKFENFIVIHLEQPMLKSVFQEVWEKEPEALGNSCSRFRLETNLNQWLIRYWQLASNKFYPSKRTGIAYERYNNVILADLQKVLLEERTNSVCINDNPYCSEEDFLVASKTIRDCLEQKFPHKSIFEKPANIL